MTFVCFRTNWSKRIVDIRKVRQMNAVVPLINEVIARYIARIVCAQARLERRNV
jgi:hypothetical protein